MSTDIWNRIIHGHANRSLHNVSWVLPVAAASGSAAGGADGPPSPLPPNPTPRSDSFWLRNNGQYLTMDFSTVIRAHIPDLAGRRKLRNFRRDVLGDADEAEAEAEAEDEAAR